MTECHELRDSGVVCPLCALGTMAPARGRFGPVWRCTHAGCDFWLRAQPTGDTCDHEREGRPCGALMVEGTRTIPVRCSDRACPNHRPDRLRAQVP